MQAFLDWSPRIGLSFPEFLRQIGRDQADIVYYMQGSARTLGALQRMQQRGWSEHLDNQKIGFTVLSRKLGSIDHSLARIFQELVGIGQDVRSGTNELVSTLRWGFGSLLTSVGRLSDVVIQIRKDGVRPSGIWAEEQFQWACYAYDKGLYPEAQEYVTNAINGIPGETGYKLEPRYHYLLGRIQIGSWLGECPNMDIEVVKPDLAEKAFLNAVRYGDESRYVFAGEKGDAYLYAARAAYLQGELGRACEHARKGLDLLNRLWSNLPSEIERGVHRSWKDAPRFALELKALRTAGIFEYAKYLCAEGKSLPEAQDQLLEAFRLNLDFTIEAKVDPDFLFQNVLLETALTRITAELRDEYAQIAAVIWDLLEGAAKFEYDGLAAKEILSEELESLRTDYEMAAIEVENGGPLDFEAGVARARQILPKAQKLFATFKSRFGEHAQERGKNSDVAKRAKQTREAVQQYAAALATLGEKRARILDATHLSKWRGIAGAAGLILFSGGLIQLLLALPTNESLHIVDPTTLFFGFALQELPFILLFGICLWPIWTAPFRLMAISSKTREMRGQVSRAEAIAAAVELEAAVANRDIQANIDGLQSHSFERSSRLRRTH